MFIKKKIFYTLTYTTLLLVSIPVYGQSNNTPIMQSQVNQPNGVAGLDNTGNVVAPIKTDKTISTTTNLDIGTLDSKPRATFFQNYGDAASSPHTIHFGGLENHSDAYLNIIGLAMGTGDASGSILSVQDADSFFYGNRNGAGLTDAIVEFTKTNNNPPRLKAGPEILNAENNTTGRTVTFTKTGFSVSPGFTEKEMQTIYGSGRIRVYSNWKNGNIISDDTKKGLHGLDRPNLYFGYIDPAKAVTTSKIINDPDSKTTKTITTTTFDVLLDTTENNLGWRTEFNENKISPDGKEKGSFAWQDNIALNTPGQNPGDTIDNINDTKSTIPSYVWSYSTPSVFIGMADKKFLHNDMAQFIPGEKEAYRKDSISRSMTGVEYDLFAMQEHDYQYKIDGIMVGADGNGHKLTTDSTDMFLGGDINHHLIIGDTCDNYAIETGGFIVPGACPTTKPNSGHILGQFNGKSNFNEKVSISIANLVKDHPEYSWGNNIPAIIAAIQPDDRDPLKATVGLGGIKWKQDNDNGSISLCGGSFAKNCALTVSSNGEVKIGMQGILALDTAGKNYVQWYPTTNGDWLIGSSIANGGNIRGVNGYYGTNATITGTVNTNSLITNNLTATQNIITKEAIRMGMKGLYASDDAGKDYVQWYPTTNGDWLIGSSIANGGNIRGVNGYYGTNATITGTINTNNLITNTLTATQGIITKENLLIGAGKATVYTTSKGKFGAYAFSDDTGNLIIQSNNDETVKGGGIATLSYTLANLPKPVTDHVMVWCSDCKINGIAGAPVWWHASIAKWTDSQNNTLTN